jgi:uncharacterized protein (DUF1015 family)
LESNSHELNGRIIAFKGIRYNQKLVKDLAKVVCPPYDVITPEQQAFYYSRSEYNVIRLEYAAFHANDTRTGRKYEIAANTLQQWMEDKVLCLDKQAAFYLHDHYFDYLDVKRKRRGLVVRVKLEPWYHGIFPHENTFPEAKNDRLQLMRACQVNISPILALYNDSHKELSAILSVAEQSTPIIDLPYSNERHVVWSITDSELINHISKLLNPEPLYIADGHHRYETALIYQNEKRESFFKNKGKNVNAIDITKSDACNYVMMTLVDFSDSGLLMSPIHRLVRGIEYITLASLRKRLDNFFTVESINLTAQTIEALRQNMIDDTDIAVFGLEPQSVILLKKLKSNAIDRLMPQNHTKAYNNLSISIFNHIVLKEILKLAEDSKNIAYSADVKEAYQQIEAGNFQLAFLLNPTGADIIKDISHGRERMPYKSTYFHPKLPTGLVMNPLY